MNGIDYVVDTNCFIYLLNEDPLVLPFLDKGWAFSFITEIELLSHKPLTNHQTSIIKAMLSTCYKVAHNQSISDYTIELRKTSSLKIPDAVIAATEHHLQLPLLTADKAFSQLKTVNSIVLEI